MLKSIEFNQFTAFEQLKIEFSPGVNIFIGENATGKTHILKAAYAACEFKNEVDLAEKINNVFYPFGKQIGRLVKRSPGESNGHVEVKRKLKKGTASLKLTLSSHAVHPKDAKMSGQSKAWKNDPLKAAYIPVKDMTANAPGFPSLYRAREIHFEEIYDDILRKAFMPRLKGRPEKSRSKLLDNLREAMGGTVVNRGEEFFLRSKQGELEFTLLAEGLRKLGLLWTLIQNGTLLEGSALFWDEPEANLNPKLMKSVVSVLLELQRMGVQVFLATHNYVVLKEFDLQTEELDKVLFHSLFRDKESGEIMASATEDYLSISPHPIGEAYDDLITRDICSQH